ncbi:hypothetical protein LOD99_12635 [Oopsacas minuta]|uniref:Methyltransferase domain-containing protein n=1 Tax=Oopsacas minuta TaxID=111878 RepID=A0AAV7JCM1_9METZ|nr:hypothetical protein LOD99_12635 [Oopsacas minuta]
MAKSSTSDDSKLYQFLQERNDPGVFPEGKESLDYWNEVADRYDNNYNGGISFKHITIGAREFDKHLMMKDVPKNAKIADIGSGTGLIGQKLKEEYHYSNMTAFDISPAMLEKAKEKSCYNDFVISDLHTDELVEYHQQFDHAISIACFVLGIIKPQALETVARLVKSGGLVTLSFREKNYDNELTGYRQKVEKMEKAGVWKQISIVLDEYMCLDPDNAVRGYYVTLQVC